MGRKSLAIGFASDARTERRGDHCRVTDDSIDDAYALDMSLDEMPVQRVTAAQRALKIHPAAARQAS